jgi:hypothetical protein
MAARLALLCAFVFAVPTTAYAFNHTGWLWPPDDMPLTWWVSDYLEDSLPQEVLVDDWNGAGDPLYYQHVVMVKSYCNWHWMEFCDTIDEQLVVSSQDALDRFEDATCADFDFEYLGTDSGHAGFTNDGVNKVYFDDPSDALGTGVNGLTSTRTTGTVVMEQGGKTYYAGYDSDIGFNNNIDWGTTADMDVSCSGSTMCLECTATHEVGHLLGMDHSCEQGEVCNDDALLTATMYWSGGPCDTSRASINSDDVDGIQALYGPFATFSSEDPLFGGAPLDVQFTVETDDVILAAAWNFGDGEKSEEVEPFHEYTSEGQFTVSVEFQGENEVCGEWDYTYRELAYVLVCEPPLAEFSYEAVDEFTYQMVNLTPVTTYGCIDELAWEVYQNGELIEVLGAWSPKIEFPEIGTYQVVMQAAGPGGGGAAELTIEVDGKAPSNCSTSGGTGGAGLAGLLAALGLVVCRRSRRD